MAKGYGAFTSRGVYQISDAKYIFILSFGFLVQNQSSLEYSGANEIKVDFGVMIV